MPNVMYMGGGGTSHKIKKMYFGSGTSAKKIKNAEI